MGHAGLSKKQRLIKNCQFRAILSQRQRRSDGLLLLYVSENDCGYPRFGISVGRSCGPAVVRNRLKRLLREACRLSQLEIPGNADYLLMMSRQWPKKVIGAPDVARAAGRLGTEQVRRSLRSLVQAGRRQ